MNITDTAMDKYKWYDILRGLGFEESLEILRLWERAIKDGAIYGYGLSKMLYWRTPAPYQRDEAFRLKGIFDRDQGLHGKKILGFDILDPARLEELVKGGHKLVIFSGDYAAIRQEMSARGLREKYDFIFVRAFWPLLSFYRYNRILSPQGIHLYVTDRCRFRCARCTLRLPLLKQRYGDRPLAAVRREVDHFFTLVDEAVFLGTATGDPMMYEELPALLDHIGAKYRHRIITFGLTTSSTDIPPRTVLSRIRQYGVEVDVSDYSEGNIEGYGENFPKLLKTLDDCGIKKYVRSGPWFDRKLSGAEKAELAAAGEEGLKKHFQECPETCALLMNGFLYPCMLTPVFEQHRLLSRDEAAHDAIDLRRLNPLDGADRLSLLMYLLGYLPEAHLKSCRFCRGKNQFKDEIPKAVQLPLEEH